MPGISRRQNASLLRQLEFCFESHTQLTLASEGEMRDRALDLLRELKVDKLAKRLRVEWNPRMRTTVGRAAYSDSLISLNPALQSFGFDEIDRTLRHELAHLLAQFRAGRHRILPHGDEWRTACRDLGIAEEKGCHNLPFPVTESAWRYRYKCPHCQRDFHRTRRVESDVTCLA